MFIIVVALIAISLPAYVLMKLGAKLLDSLLATVFILSFLISWYTLNTLSKDYFEQIDGFEIGYTPFAHAHRVTLYTLFILPVVALVMLWFKQRALPPLLLLIVVSMILIGIVLNIAIIMQISEQTDLISGNKQVGITPFSLTSLSYLTIATTLFVRLLRSEAKLSVERKYKNPLLLR